MSIKLPEVNSCHGVEPGFQIRAVSQIHAVHRYAPLTVFKLPGAGELKSSRLVCSIAEHFCFIYFFSLVYNWTLKHLQNTEPIFCQGVLLVKWSKLCPSKVLVLYGHLERQLDKKEKTKRGLAERPKEKERWS